MLLKASLTAVALALSIVSSGSVVASDPAHSLTVGEGFVDPVGFHDATPTFSWKLPDGVSKQTAYRIEVTDDKAADNKVLWESGWVESDQSLFVPYAGTPLASRQSVAWRVDYQDQSGEAAGWSDRASFELGLLSADDWQASWISPAVEVDASKEPVTMMRRDFSVGSGIKQARLYVTALGVFELTINGQRIGDDAFTPGWTSYADRVETLTYDVTDQISNGENVIGALLGTGWYSGRLGWKHDKNLKNLQSKLLVQLEIENNDGSTQVIASDDQWKSTADGPIRSSSIYDGETYDARKEMAGWNEPGFDDSKWKNVVADKDLGNAELLPKLFATVKVIQEVPAVKITEPTPGHFVFDFGQNMVGWIGLEMPGVKGETVTMRFAEMLSPDGSIYTENYRSAKSTNRYTARQTGPFKWQPTFTFHGFRYVELTGVGEGLKPEKDWVTGLVLHSDLNQTGTFSSSHQKLNRLQQNISWGQRGNFLDIPTDCPQRDERLGWTGDAQAFCSTAMFNYDSHAFFKSWLGTMRDDQLDDGQIPHVIPDILKGAAGSPGWMDAATIIPWEVYVRTGDQEMLAENYEMMQALVGWYREKSPAGVVRKIGGFGDWLQPNTDEKKGETASHLLGSAFYAKSVKILADSAVVLGNKDDAQKFAGESMKVNQAFTKHYFDAEGKLQNAPETQTAYILALEFNIVPESLRGKLEANLLRLIEEADGHLRTGFLGTPYIAKVLDRAGHPDVSYSLLFKETYPSWFFSINQGATTMWERWDSYTHEKGFHPQKMNSFNHYAYGAIGEWMYERVAGLAVDPANPGYKHFFVRPVIGGPLTSARAELETGYGTAVSGWELDGDTLTMEVVVPPNTTATIEFPNDRKSEKVTAGQHEFTLKL